MCLIYSRYRKDIKSFNQEALGVGLEDFQCSSICLLANNEAKAITSAWCLLYKPSTGDTPKIAIVGQGFRKILRASDSVSKKHNPNECKMCEYGMPGIVSI